MAYMLVWKFIAYTYVSWIEQIKQPCARLEKAVPSSWFVAQYTATF